MRVNILRDDAVRGGRVEWSGAREGGAGNGERRRVNGERVNGERVSGERVSGERVNGEGDSANRNTALALRRRHLQHCHNPQKRRVTQSLNHLTLSYNLPCLESKVYEMASSSRIIPSRQC